MMNFETPDILIADHSSINADLINDVFFQHHITANFSLSESVPELLKKLAEKEWHTIIIVIDDMAIAINALVKAMPKKNKRCPIIILSHDYNRESALDYLHSGATDVFSLNEIAHLAERTQKLLSENKLITKTQHQHKKLVESNKRFLALIEAIPLGIAFIHDGAFINTNLAFQNFFSTSNFDETSFLDLIEDNHIKKVKNALKKATLKNSQTNSIIKAINVKKGEDEICSVNLLISTAHINDEHGLQIIIQPIKPIRKESHIVKKAHIHSPAENNSTTKSADQNWANKIKDALTNDKFKLVFQPIVSLGANQESLYEVLLRIKDSNNDNELPNQFLHFAQQSKLEVEIDKWVIKNAVDILEKDNKDPIRFFINLSESSLKDWGFIEWLQENYDSQVMNLVFEIPEAMAMEWQPETLRFIQKIKALEGAICIEHFGNNPDKREQVSALNADFHKIDGGFIENLSTNRKNQSLVTHICQDTKKPTTKLIAAYVQDADSLAILWQEGIDFIQGNYLQPPESHLDYKFEGQI